jgi:hypothetical protein
MPAHGKSVARIGVSLLLKGRRYTAGVRAVKETLVYVLVALGTALLFNLLYLCFDRFLPRYQLFG